MFGAGLNMETLVFISIIAFVPSIIYTVIIRYVEKYDREPWGSIGIAFLWGATIAVIVVTIIKGWYLVEMPNMYPDLASDSVMFTLYGECLLLPFAAVLVKGLGLYYVKEDMEEAEDGLIYGAVIGLGFAATKNLIYGISISTLYNFGDFIDRILISSLTVVLTESSATAVIGYGVSRLTARKHTTRHSAFTVVPFFLAAVVMHILFSLVVNFGGTIFGAPDENFLAVASLSLVVAIVYSLIMMSIVYVKIWRLDRLDEERAWEVNVADLSGSGSYTEAEVAVTAKPKPRYASYAERRRMGLDMDKSHNSQRPSRPPPPPPLEYTYVKGAEVRKKYQDTWGEEEGFEILDEDEDYDTVESDDWMDL